MNKFLRFSSLVAAIFAMNSAVAQTTVTGSVSDKNESLVGASVYFEDSSSGTQTNLNGEFEFTTELKGKKTLVISFVGYISAKKEVTLSGGSLDVGAITLESNAIGMDEVNVIASIGKDRKTPVAMSTVSAEEIELANAGSELPEALNTTPAIYATKGGGGFGDSRINIRGFDQRNVAVLLNGVPVNDMENGWVYWSNWSGIGDAVSTIQVQRGLGASKLAINSVGGTMNIITKTTDATKGGSVEVSTTDYGKQKTMLSLSSGRLANGWAVSFVGSRTQGQGYVDGTYIDAWSYFGSVAKELNENHMLQLTIIGAPQKHGQRDNSQFSAQSYSEIDQVGRKYNPNWGYVGGAFLNERNNYYHKPQTALNWYWNINEKSYLSTSAYISTGTGGGSGILGKSPIKYGPGQNAMNQRDWDYAVALNSADSTMTNGTGSYLIMRNSVNNHFWTGVLSTFKHSLNDNLNLILGLDGRYYKGEHYREVRDLLGGSHWDDAVNPEAMVGDRIAYDNDGTVFYTGLFGQLEYSNDMISAYVAGSGSNTQYGRTDRYNFARGNGELEAAKVTQTGFNGKAGLNINLNDNHNVFLSGGYYSRAPFHNFVYTNFSNDVNPNISNETITAGEIGYGFKTNNVNLKVNGYYSNWADKWTRASITTDVTTGAKSTVYFQGLDELHTGVEFEATVKVNSDLEVGLFGSFGNWIYTKDAAVTIFDDNRNPIGEGTIYSKDLKVADAPQQQYGAKFKYVIKKNVIIGGSYVQNEELYAKFDVASRQDPDDRTQSYKLDGFGVMNGYVRVSFPVGSANGSFSLNANNIFDAFYAQEGWDNAVKDANGERIHGRDNFVGFWGWGRNFRMSFKVRF